MSTLEISAPLSANTQAILLLTAPLIVGSGDHSKELLTPSEYGKLARFLYSKECQPADLVTVGGDELVLELGQVVNTDRLKRLVARGFLLSQAIERWRARAIWVVSRAESTIGIGELAAQAQRTIISGGARGIDQAAMSGALEAGGKAAGVLADSLERAALNRENRNYLRDGQLVLISPYDPQAGFNIGNAMQRNKLIYALADAALVVQSEYGKGGTWAGAIEQLDKLRLVPVYTLPNAQQGAALETLAKKGALTWPDPTTPEEFRDVLTARNSSSDTEQLSFSKLF